MADTITISCPECDKAIKAPEDVVGKKIRCKGCGETFTAKAPKSAKPPEKPKAKAKPPEKPKAAPEDADGAYGITDEYLGARCPECAEKMDDGDIICLACGYNTTTRTKPKRRKVKETTGGDVFLWLLPGIGAVLFVIGLITANLLYILLVSPASGEDSFYSAGVDKAMKIWAVIVSLFLGYFAGRFAVSRLIYNYKPPEIEEKWDQKGG